jgi:hypothetical protein
MGESGVGICVCMGFSLLLVAAVLAILGRGWSPPLDSPATPVPPVSATVEDFVLYRDRYVEGHQRYGSFEVHVVSPTTVMIQKLLAVVSSESHGAYFVTQPITATQVSSEAPLKLKAEGPIGKDELAHLISAEYGHDGELILDRLRPPTRSSVALVLEDGRGTFLARTRFNLSGPDLQLAASGFQQPEFFAASTEGPTYYERQVRPVVRTFSDRIVDYWNSPTAVTNADYAVKTLVALVGLFGVLVWMSLNSQKELLKSHTGWRSIPRFEQRMVTEYLRPLAGQEVLIAVPFAETDAEAHNYGRLLQSILDSAQWKTELRALGPGVVREEFPKGLFLVALDSENAAVRPLKRAFAKASIDLRDAFTYPPYGNIRKI